MTDSFHSKLIAELSLRLEESPERRREFLEIVCADAARHHVMWQEEAQRAQQLEAQLQAANAEVNRLATIIEEASTVLYKSVTREGAYDE